MIVAMNGSSFLNRDSSPTSSSPPSLSPFLNCSIHPSLTTRQLQASNDTCSNNNNTLVGLVQQKLIIDDDDDNNDGDTTNTNTTTDMMKTDNNPTEEEALPSLCGGRPYSLPSSTRPAEHADGCSSSSPSTSSSILQALRKKSLHRGQQAPCISASTLSSSSSSSTTTTCMQMESSQTKKARERAVRGEMIQMLETRLRIKCQTGTTSSSSNNNNNDPEQVPKTARILEQLLFKQSNSNLKTYMDKSTLDGRLRSIMTVLVRRKMILNPTNNNKSKLSSSTPSSSSSISDNNNNNFNNNNNNNNNKSRKHQRTVMLQRLLGRERYIQIRTLVRQIQMVKMKKVASLKCCYGPSCSFFFEATPSPCAKTFGENLPSVIRRLYFETTLLPAFEIYDLKRIQREVRSWDALVEQAQDNLREYEEWEAAGGVMAEAEVFEGYAR